MYILQPDINLSLNRGGSWATVPTTATSYFVETDNTDYENSTLMGPANYRASFEVLDWTAGTYNTDDYVRHATSIFRCVQDSVTSEPSKTNTTDWAWIAFSNKYNAINGILGSRTYGYSTTSGEFQDWTMSLKSSATTEEYSSVDGTSVVSDRSSKPTQLAFLNLFEVDSIHVEIRKADDTTVVFDETYSTGNYSLGGMSVGWSAYFDLPKDDTNIDEIGRSLIVDIPVVAGGFIYVTFMSSGTARMRGIGGVFTGRATQLGITNYGSSMDVTDFSRIEANDFGQYEFVSRTYKNNFTYNFLLQESDINPVKQRIYRNRAYPCVFYGLADRQETINYGVVEDFNAPLAPNQIIATLDIKGV